MRPSGKRTAPVHNVTMRIESSVTSLSWIPSEAVRGATRVAFDAGFTHYDEPPPDVIEDLEALRKADRFRFANLLAAWMDVDGDGRSGFGYSGRRAHGLDHRGSGRIQAGVRGGGPSRPEAGAARVGEGWVRFTQTAGGRTGLPAPRRVRRRPFIQWQAPLVWSTLSLTLHADGPPEFEVLGASRFPRHWIFDGEGQLAGQVGPHRLPRLVPQVVRQAHPLGRPGLAGPDHRGRDGARAHALGAHDGQRQAEVPKAEGRRDPGHRGGGRDRRLPRARRGR